MVKFQTAIKKQIEGEKRKIFFSVKLCQIYLSGWQTEKMEFMRNMFLQFEIFLN